MKDHPILFSGAMVRALLDGTKTQTRRVVKPQPAEDRAHDHVDVQDGLFTWWAGNLTMGIQHQARCPYGQPGGRLWVRETWADLEQITDGSFARQAIYRADDIDRYGDEDEYVDVTAADMRWRPSIYMPRWASRILLEVVSVRVERLNDCSRKDAIAEGIHRYEHVWRDCEYPLDDVAYEPVVGGPTRYSCPIQAYQALWESINGAGSWEANPWVWVVEFKRAAP